MKTKTQIPPPKENNRKKRPEGLLFGNYPMSSSLVVTKEDPVPKDTTAVSSSLHDQPKFDFIGNATAIKDVFALPYSTDRRVSVAVHNLHGTLLLDEGEDPKSPSCGTFHHNSAKQPYNSNEEWTSPSLAGLPLLQTTPESTEAVTIVKNSLTQLKGETAVAEPVPEPGSFHAADRHHPIPVSPEPREYLPFKFHDMDMLVGSNALIYRSPENPPTAVRVEDAENMRAISAQHTEAVASGNFVPDHQLIQQKPSYAEAVQSSEQIVESPLEKPSNLVDQVELKNCIIPNPSNDGPVASLMRVTQDVKPPEASTPDQSRTTPVSPVTTVLDTYLDNIMADVPQLALCLREKGFIQSIKLLSTTDIPNRLLHKKTLDTSIPFATICDNSGDPDDQIFSPDIMEMNAHALLRFLKANCSKDNTTYILRREAGCSNVQLFDISSQHQKQWIWRLANLSYRFANRLKNLSLQHPSKSRNFRTRQRSLLQTTLELLETLADHEGHRHESLVAAVNEALGDTFLVAGTSSNTMEDETQHSPTKPVSSHLPYSQISFDSLGKAEDHLVYGVKVLRGLLDTQRDPSNDDHGLDGRDRDENDSPLKEEIQPVLTQLLGLSEKLVHVNLRMALESLHNYSSSSAMHNLRKAAQRLAACMEFLELLDEKASFWTTRLQHQHAWLWEQCGHFARSFAADQQWRELGHSNGEDVVGVLYDVETALKGAVSHKRTSIEIVDLSKVSSLCGVVDYQSPGFTTNDNGLLRNRGIDDARIRLASHKTLQRERLNVLVAGLFAYSRAVDILHETVGPDETPLRVLKQRLGDSCNELGKVMLDELRALILSSPKSVETGHIAEALSSSAEFHFQEGLNAFQVCDDRRNSALLRCNLCQCYKLRANAIFSLIVAKAKTPHSEACLERAAAHLSAAHEILEVRDFDQGTWDMVSNELAATYLVLGIRRRQSVIGAIGNKNMFIAGPLPPGTELSIADPVERALKIYNDMGNVSQTAASHYQLALFYSKIWTNQRDETKTREKLAKAFHHFQEAYQSYRKVIQGHESTFALVSMDLADLYATVCGEEGSLKALLCCLDTSVSFNRESMQSMAANLSKRSGWFQQMDVIALSVEEKTFKLLKGLVKLRETSDLGSKQLYKDMYRAGLSAKISSPSDGLCLGDAKLQGLADHISSLRLILHSISDVYSVHIKKAP